MRAWVAERCDPYTDPIPEIPPEMVFETACVYVQSFERITGLPFEPPADEPILDRIRRNLRDLF